MDNSKYSPKRHPQYINEWGVAHYVKICKYSSTFWGNRGVVQDDIISHFSSVGDGLRFFL